MNFSLGEIILRRPEPKDVEALYQQKNDPMVAMMLGGFSFGYSREDLRLWVEHHRTRRDEIIWVIASSDDDRCLGHVGLYKIDFRVRSAEFAVMVGDIATQGRGLGRRCTQFALDYGFDQLNLNRISLEVLASNERAVQLYRSIGFREEGVLREAQYKNGEYLDVVLMGLLRADARSNGDG